MNRTLPLKRHRRRYLQVQQRVRQMVSQREEQEQQKLQVAKVTATVMSLIREVLELPTPEDEKKYIDPSCLQYSGINLGTVKKSLKYLSEDFKPEKIYEMVVLGYHWQTGITDWLRVRHAIVEVVDGERDWGIIPSCYYGFPDNKCFYFDAKLVENPKGHNHTSWRKVKEPVHKEESPKEVPVRLSWWRRFVECRACR